MDKRKECSKCGGKMKRGIYLAQTIAYEAMKKVKRLQASGHSGVTTIWNGGPGKIEPCMKCERCGRSVTL